MCLIAYFQSVAVPLGLWARGTVFQKLKTHMDESQSKKTVAKLKSGYILNRALPHICLQQAQDQ